MDASKKYPLAYVAIALVALLLFGDKLLSLLFQAAYNVSGWLVGGLQ